MSLDTRKCRQALRLGLILIFYLLAPTSPAASVSTPTTQAIEQRLTLSQTMKGWMASGVLGLDARGYLIIRGLHRAPQTQHARVRFLLGKDQRERDAWLGIQRQRGGSDAHRRLFEMTYQQLPMGSWFQGIDGWKFKHQ